MISHHKADMEDLAWAMTHYPHSRVQTHYYAVFDRVHLLAFWGNAYTSPEFEEALIGQGWRIETLGGAPHGEYDIIMATHIPPKHKQDPQIRYKRSKE